MKLVSGAVQALFSSQTDNPLYKAPVLQITALSIIPNPNSEKHRYKANLSDGKFYMKAVFSSEMTSLFDSKQIEKYYLIKLGIFAIRSKDTNNYLYIQSIAEFHPCEYEIGKSINITADIGYMKEKESIETRKRVSMDTVSRNKQLKKDSHCMENKTEDPMERFDRDSIGNSSCHINSKEDIMSRKDMEKETSRGGYTDIRSITPFQPHWKIKGRITAKYPVRSFQNSKGSGKVFSFDLMDSTGEIKCTGFADTVDMFYNSLDVDKVVEISQGTIKPANKRYSNLQAEYEIQLNKMSRLQIIENDDTIPRNKFNFSKIRQINPTSNTVDVIGVIKEIYPLSDIMVRTTGKELEKRDIIIVDETGDVRVTFWGDKATLPFEENQVIAMKYLKPRDYNNTLVLSTLSSTHILMNPDIPESIEIMRWYKDIGRDMKIDHTRRTPKIVEIGLINGGSGDYKTVKGTIVRMKEEKLYYTSCPNEGCVKKVIAEDETRYRCDRCNYTFDKCIMRYMANICIGDHSGDLWISVFDSGVECLFGKSADEFHEICEMSPLESQEIVKNTISKEYVFVLRIREEEYNGELKKRYGCTSVRPLDTVAETKRLLKMIKK